MNDRLRETSSNVRRPLVPAQTARSLIPPARPAAAARRIPWLLALALLLALGASPGRAQDVSEEEMRSLDEQVQEIKSDVLGIAAQLSLLEERLLYPTGTQVAVFVSVAEGQDVRLDSVRIDIDGEPVAHHVYSFKELEALRKGGVQRLYTGNVSTGAHRLDVAVAGKLPGGADFTASESFDFRKEVEPELLGITLGGSPGAPVLELGGW